MAQVVPGILTVNEQDYLKRLRLADTVVPLVQIDIVDGKFSANKTIGIEVVKRNIPRCPLEIQLMVVSPAEYITQLNQNFISKIIFPFESRGNFSGLVDMIKKMDKVAGISLNPDTDIKTAQKHFEEIDMLLLMTGKPGYSGQQLGENTFSRIKEVKNVFPSLPVEIDIGVNLENANRLARAGADYLVASSALYGSGNFADAYAELAQEALSA